MFEFVSGESDGKSLDTSTYTEPDPDVVFAEPCRGVVSEGFTLEIELEKPTVVPGRPVILRLLLTNRTDETLHFAESGPIRDYWLDVKDGQGKRLCAEQDIRDADARSIQSLAPLDERSYKYRVDRMYDISSPGTYTITASRQVLRLDGQGFGNVVSNTVKLVISEDQQLALGSTRPKSRNAGEVAPSNSGAKPRLVPVRSLLEDRACRVVWDSSLRQVTVMTANGLRAIIKAGSDTLVLSGRSFKMWSPATVVSGRLYAPGDALSQITAFATSKAIY
jgi:hypothetical protein